MKDKVTGIKKKIKNKSNNKSKNDYLIDIKITKRAFVIILIIILLLGVFLLVRGCSKNKDNLGDLDVEYSDGRMLYFGDFEKDFTTTRTFTVRNTSNKTITYSLEWDNVANSLKKQNQFLYEIRCYGVGCDNIGKSQVPVTKAPITEYKIGPYYSHVYVVTFTYKGSEKGEKMIGELVVNENEKQVKEKKSNNQKVESTNEGKKLSDIKNIDKKSGQK